MALRDLPEGVVVAALGRLDAVELRSLLVAPAGVGLPRDLLRLACEGVRRVLLPAADETARGLLGGGDGGPVRVGGLLPEAGDPGREARGRGAQEEDGGDELAREELARTRAGNPRGQPDAGDGGLHLHEHAGGELRPGDPHDEHEDAYERLGVDGRAEPFAGRPVRYRAPHLDEPERHPEDEREQRDDGEERLHHVPERPAAGAAVRASGSRTVRNYVP
ncbi:conserved hypothetical protein [Streptomyces sp. SPB78]|nr:conserved hypothetical protein [Streptomyces sp. SPB78]